MFVFFQPHKLFIDDRVNEAPVPTAEPDAGEAVVTHLGDGNRVLRFEDFRTSNGPDLRVYLSAGSNDANFGAEYGRDFVDLG